MAELFRHDLQASDSPVAAVVPTVHASVREQRPRRYQASGVRASFARARGSWMRALGPILAAAVLVGLAGCGSETKAVMPSVTGQKLDVAKGAIKDAGVDGEIKVEGGGVFGVVNEANWKVCEQSPAAGTAVSDSPRLKVDRACGDAKASEAPKAGEQPSETAQPQTTASSEPAKEQILTAKNNKDLAALWAVGDDCDARIATFASKYGGRTIAFGGSIRNMMNHGAYDTRYDILLAPGSKGPESTRGPNLKFEDVNVFDLKLTGANVPDSIGEGDLFRFVAKVGEYNQDQCMLFLNPVSTRPR